MTQRPHAGTQFHLDLDFGGSRCALAFPNPLGGTAAFADGIDEIRRHRTQKLECFDQIGLARCVYADEHIQRLELQRVRAGGERQKTVKPDF